MMEITPSTPAAVDPKRRQLKKACEQFEAIFAKELLGEMRKSTHQINLGGDQTGSEIYKDMMDQAIADAMAHQGALGIGKILYRQFEKALASSTDTPQQP